jgi:cell division transport system permease protein
MRLQFVLSEIAIGLRRNLTMTISVILVTLVSLFLFGLGILSQKQVSTMKDYWYDRVQVSIFLCGQESDTASCAAGEVTQAQKDQILTDLKAPQLAPYIERVFFESKQEAYDRFKQQFKDSVLSDNVSVDQMPESYRVRLKNPEQYPVVSQAFSERPGVESVEDQRKVLDQLFSLLNRLTFYSWVLAVITLACSMLLVATTIRLTAFTRRRETGIMRLVGASNLFIQLPFILESVIAATVGSLLASGALVAVTHFEIQGRLSNTLRIFNYVGVSDALAVVPWMILVGVLIAGVSSFVTLLRYLKV